jgi:CheY-like chemotaxis protein
MTTLKKILLVDNEADVTYALENALENYGFSIDSFNDSMLALNSYKSNFYDLVILDIKMPKMDGFELYNKIKEKDPKMKICFLTASEMFYEEIRKTRYIPLELISAEGNETISYGPDFSSTGAYHVQSDFKKGSTYPISVEIMSINSKAVESPIKVLFDFRTA